MRLSIFLILTFILHFFGIEAYSQSYTLGLPDTTVYQGTTVLLPIQAILPQTVINQPFTILVRIPKNRILFLTAKTSTNSIIACTDITVTNQQSTNASYNEYALFCANGCKDTSGILCYLECEILAGKETSSSIKIMSILIGNDPQTFSQKGGLLNFPDPSVIPAGQEAMEVNRPNPFQFTTDIPYYISADCDITFTLFSSNGKALKVFPTTFITSGRHIFKVTVDNPTDFASGVYILRMQTPRGLYHLSMVHQK